MHSLDNNRYQLSWASAYVRYSTEGRRVLEFRDLKEGDKAIMFLYFALIDWRIHRRRRRHGVHLSLNRLATNQAGYSE